MVKDLKWAFLGCVHCPITDVKAWSWAMKHLESHQPDVIVWGGDQLDCEAISSHAKSGEWTIHQEWEDFRQKLIEVRALVPGHKAVILDGNHEDRLHRGAVPKDIRNALNYMNWLPDDDGPTIRQLLKGSVTRPYINRRTSARQVGGTYSLGQVTFYHGYSVAGNSQVTQAKRFADEFGLGVSCHTHTPVEVTQVIDPGKVYTDYYYCNSGTLIDWDAHAQYAGRYNIDGWGHGIVIGECRTGGEGRIYRRSREWSAEVLVLDRVYSNGRTDS